VTVRLEAVTIRYGARTAVDGVDAVIPAGAVGLLGRNGAGKSSILKALLGLVRPSSGRMTILDLPADAPPDVIRSRVGYMPERDCYLPGMSGFEMVALLASLSGLPERDAWRRAHEALYLVGLEEQRYRPVAGYSTGMRQKAKLAAALVHDPAVLFLDEPTNGLDPGGRAEMLGLVRQLCRDLGKSVVLSTHILQDVEQVCDAVVVLDQGKVVAQGALKELLATSTEVFEFLVEPADVRLQAAAGVQIEPIDAGRYRVVFGRGGSTRELFALVQQSGGQVRQLVQRRRTLEELFLGAVGQTHELRA
jgi:ABC-2 type transport system ATP-binding protein